MVENQDMFSWIEWIVMRGALLALMIIGLGNILVEALQSFMGRVKSFRRSLRAKRS